ncbi:hypothetical protein ACFLZQ_07100 [Thermodesulfobacteriota bacterium]
MSLGNGDSSCYERNHIGKECHHFRASLMGCISCGAFIGIFRLSLSMQATLIKASLVS